MLRSSRLDDVGYLFPTTQSFPDHSTIPGMEDKLAVEVVLRTWSGNSGWRSRVPPKTRRKPQAVVMEKCSTYEQLITPSAAMFTETDEGDPFSDLLKGSHAKLN